MTNTHQAFLSRSARLATVGLTLVLLSPPAAAQVDYVRAEQLLPWYANPLVSGDSIRPNWMLDKTRFWYRNKTAQGAEFVLVDPVRNTRQLLFDPARLAAAMSVANDTSYDAIKMPFRTFRFVDNERAIEFVASKKRFTCQLGTYACVAADTLPDTRGYVVSPDSMWEAFASRNNLWVRPRRGGDSVQLTTDGEEFYSYGVRALRPQQLLAPNREPQRPEVRWSPDSKKLAVTRTDERRVQHMHYVSYTSQRPRHFSQPYALPGDTIVPLPEVYVIDLGATTTVTSASGDAAGNSPTTAATETKKTETRLAPKATKIVLPVVATQLSLVSTPRDSTWSGRSDRFNFIFQTRASKALYLIEVDGTSGAARVIAKDSAKTFVETSPRDPPAWYTTEDGDNIWWSERDGWAHLYRYDRTGTLKNQITSGPWAVGTVSNVDETAKQIYFTARGREAGRLLYHAHLYRVNFDGSALTLLTPEDADHEIDFSPGGKYFVDTYSAVATPPVTVLRSAVDGRVVQKLESADVSRLAARGWTPGSVFSVKARDGVTDIYGVMYRPSDFDSTRTYPVINYIYPGPQVGSVGSWGWSNGGEQRAIAELGFIVLKIDHLGTPLRSKAFHDNYYGNFGDNGLPDHIAAIRQLAARHRYIDLDRVGIYGHSGGGFASTDAILRYPDFFKVAVSGAGNHDNRSYNIYWSEKYQGLLVKDTIRKTDNFTTSANKTMAANLRGHLLLMHGDMDDNVHPAMTIQVVNELIKANRDFDLVIAPDRGHGLNEPYFIRRRWDYFVRHLAGLEPPREYEIKRPEN